MKERTILVIAPPFFGYAERIADKLKEKYQSVDLLHTLESEFYMRSLYHINTKWSQQLLTSYIQNYYLKKVSQLKNSYDQILIIHGCTIPLESLEWMRLKYKNSEMYLYIWDDMRNAKYTKSFLQHFDRVFSYSKLDSEEFGFTYRPFYFSKQGLFKKSKEVSFVGSLYNERYIQLKQIMSQAKDVQFDNYIYSPILPYFRTYTTHQAKFSAIHFSKLSYNDYIEFIGQSVATLEIPHFKQRNVTTRAIEVLGTHTKLITSSKSIQDFDFYQSENIFMYDEQYNFSQLREWLSIPYKNLDEDIQNKYSLECWIQEIFH